MEKETIPAISGYLVNSIPDTETPRFVGYGNLPNTVPENHGLFLGVSIASIPDINLPAFQLSFGDKFASSTGDLTFICANYSPSDPEQSLSNLVCLDETTFQSFFSQTGSEPPQPNEWCVISFAEFVANNPTLPITKGNSFENLTAFQTACSVCIQHLIRMKASKNTNYNRIFFIPETTEEENGGEDEESNAADGLGEDEGDNSIDEEGNEDDAVVEAPPSKRTRRPRNSNTEPGERSSPRLSREDYHDPFQNPFQMPPAPNTRGGKVGGARGGRGRGRGAGGKGRGAGSVQKNKKTATPAIVPPVKKTKATDSNTPGKAISVAVGSKTGDFTTPVTYQKQAQGSSDGQFTTIIGQQKETLGYNGQILDQALTFAERWFNRYVNFLLHSTMNYTFYTFDFKINYIFYCYYILTI
jgi:hypothetical protein